MNDVLMRFTARLNIFSFELLLNTFEQNWEDSHLSFRYTLIHAGNGQTLMPKSTKELH